MISLYDLKKVNTINFLVGFCLIMLVSCSSTSEITNDTDSGSQNITNVTLTSRNPDCNTYVNSYVSSINYIKNDVVYSSLNGSLTITSDQNAQTCTFSTNSIPNHNVGEDGSFATDVSEVSESFTISSSPTNAGSPTELSLAMDNAVFLNGAKLDLYAAGCYNVGDGKIGCNDNYTKDKYWRFDPMSPLNNFGTDNHNAHTQPNGAYHYHGDPKALYDQSSTTIESPVIGFAADGYPIFGPYFNDSGTIRKAESCYTTKSGARTELENQEPGFFPGGSYDGTYIQDYEFNQANFDAGTCDLDECNGMTIDGSYGYYVTDSYPWVLKCFKGTVNASFNKAN